MNTIKVDNLFKKIRYLILGYENLIDLENECAYLDLDVFNCDAFISLNLLLDFMEYREFMWFLFVLFRISWKEIE